MSIEEPSVCSSSLTDEQRHIANLETQLAAAAAEQEQLRRDLELRTAALNAGTSHFMILDAAVQPHRICYVNRPLAKAHGYEPHELLDQEAKRLLKPGPATSQLLDEMRAAIAGGEPYRTEVEAQRRDGSTFWLGFTSIGLRDANDAVSHIVIVGADITSRLEAERKRKELQEQLISEMRERERMAIELRLAQRLESVGRLAAGLAHEINTPIQYVCDSVHFLRDAFDDLLRLLDACRESLHERSTTATAVDDQSVAKLEQEIDYEFLRLEFPRAFARTLEGTDRVAGLVRAMKEFAHPDTSEHSPADLNHALETTLIVCRNEYKYSAHVVTELAPLPSVMCNIGELNQVFLNLIVNAAHGIQDSGKDVDSGCIRVSTCLSGSTVEVTIADNGCGIPAENIEKIFDPFFTTKEVGRGTGQGLAIARAIVVDKHGGDIRVTSEPGVGTTFTIVLPISHGIAEAA